MVSQSPVASESFAASILSSKRVNWMLRLSRWKNQPLVPLRGGPDSVEITAGGVIAFHAASSGNVASTAIVNLKRRRVSPATTSSESTMFSPVLR